jgi:prohead serine protease
MNPETHRSALRTLLHVTARPAGEPSLTGGLDENRTPEDAASPNQTRPILEFIASDESLDRYQEIIVASGWRLESYRRNPVFQNAHQYGDVIFTLGKALMTEVRQGRLFQSIEFATGVNPLAKIAYGLYKGKFLNAVSVGFIPLRWENGSVEAGFRRKYLEQELLEVSAVGIPANANALQLGLSAGAIEESDLRDLADALAGLLSNAPSLQRSPNPFHDFRSRQADPGTITPALGAGINGAELLQLTRELRAILGRA